MTEPVFQGRPPAADIEPRDRVGVPMEPPPEERESRGGASPARQRPQARHFHRAGTGGLTPVFGSAQPPHGVSGALRGLAYSIPEHHAPHWMTLLLADRVDVLESRIGRYISLPLRSAGLEGAGESVRKNPLPVLLGALMGMVLLKRLG